MILRPKESEVVVHCRSGALEVFQLADWDLDRSNAESICSLDASEAAALAAFIRYWTGSRPPINRMPNVDSEYDW